MYVITTFKDGLSQNTYTRPISISLRSIRFPFPARISLPELPAESMFPQTMGCLGVPLGWAAPLSTLSLCMSQTSLPELRRERFAPSTMERPGQTLLPVWTTRLSMLLPRAEHVCLQKQRVAPSVQVITEQPGNQLPGAVLLPSLTRISSRNPLMVTSIFPPITVEVGNSFGMRLQQCKPGIFVSPATISLT